MNQKAFTLLELIMVVLIVAILATLAMPLYEDMKEKAIAVEAIQILDSMIIRIQLCHLQNTDHNLWISDERLYADAMETEDWHFSFNGKSAAETLYTVEALRKKGKYPMSFMELSWNYGNNSKSWIGDHSGTPGGATLDYQCGSSDD